jgi:hypothetical protein
MCACCNVCCLVLVDARRNIDRMSMQNVVRGLRLRCPAAWLRRITAPRWGQECFTEVLLRVILESPPFGQYLTMVVEVSTSGDSAQSVSAKRERVKCGVIRTGGGSVWWSDPRMESAEQLESYEGLMETSFSSVEIHRAWEVTFPFSGGHTLARRYQISTM